MHCAKVVFNRDGWEPRQYVHHERVLARREEFHVKRLDHNRAGLAKLVPPPARKLSRLLLDNFAYWAVNKIVNRATQSGIFEYPMVVSPHDIIGRRVISTGNFELTQFDAVDYLLSDSEAFIGIALV